jgi:hypothetical protein
VVGASNHHIVDGQVRFELADDERFSRIRFALRVLDILNPDIDVTVYSALRHLHVHTGRDWSQGPDARWALVAIPPRASRYHIAFALAELAGKAHHPYVVDLVGAASTAA